LKKASKLGPQSPKSRKKKFRKVVVVKVVLAQIGSKLGDVAGNTQRVLDSISQVSRNATDLIVFPELCLTGYPPRDLLETPSLVDDNLAALQKIAEHVTGKVAVILGYVDKNSGSTGKPFHNAAALLRGGKIAGRYFKRLLPYYGVFEDERYFEPGHATAVWTIAGKRVGITVCEDAWNEAGFVPRLYAVDPLRELKNQRCDVVVNLSASPFHLDKPNLRHELFKKGALKCGAPIVFCNQVAGHDDLIFDGCSFVVDAQGEVALSGPAFESALLEWPSRQAALPSASSSWSESQWIQQSLQFGIREYCEKTGIHKVILGLSGGIDSSVVAALAANALGASNVIGVSLPSRFTSEGTRKDAQAIAEKLGIHFHEFSMDEIFAKYRDTLSPFLKGETPLVEENLQPRIRMILLMALSQKFGALLLNTSNKSEIACGYATLYGDTAGALSVLGDLTKARVYEVAHQLNRLKDCIPRSALERPPSAELRADQKDEDSLPPYSILDPMVTLASESGLDAQGLQTQFPKHHVNTFESLYRASEFKRFQMPPVLRVTTRSFGRGRRIPLASQKPF
jgi:NAD+ synthase (glutamine-hydrolysing)